MDTLLYWLARGILGFIRLLPLSVAGRAGRAGGALFHALDARHRRMAISNMEKAFAGEKQPEEIRRLVRENFRRIGESFVCAVKTADMPPEEIRGVLEITGTDGIIASLQQDPEQSLLFAIGHFGNFELYARADFLFPNFRRASTYRGLRQPSLERLLRETRERSGCVFFERRSGARALQAALREKKIVLGLLADQHAGDNGLRLPFLGRECSTSAAPAVLAQRYGCRLFPAVCYRVALGKWRIEVGREIPLREQESPRSSEEIMLEVNRAFEAAVRRDPANWFWVHNRWKPAPRKKEKAFPAPSAESSALEP